LLPTSGNDDGADDGLDGGRERQCSERDLSARMPSVLASIALSIEAVASWR